MSFPPHPGPARLFHFSYHKCLTVFYKGVMRRTMRATRPFGPEPYVHLNSHVDRLPDAAANHRLVSVNNHHVPLDGFGDVRASRFIRDPRDLLVSGYHYHKRGAEPWCLVVDPSPVDWAVVNGTIPAALPAGTSYADFLTAASVEDGLLAELDFRRAHFDSMMQWPQDDPRVLLLRYEDVLGHEQESFDRLLAHYRVGPVERRVGHHYARKLSAGERTGGRSTAHIRDPRPRQWESQLTPRVLDTLDERHPGLLARYGYV
ncbi:hypothetical protein ACXR2U_08620 [Jatrophihabitans sp. YIM 134969]